jgi:hypothetical protein
MGTLPLAFLNLRELYCLTTQTFYYHTPCAAPCCACRIQRCLVAEFEVWGVLVPSIKTFLEAFCSSAEKVTFFVPLGVRHLAEVWLS